MKIQRALIERLYKCDACVEGVVKVVSKQVKDSISIDVKSCNNCKKSFGFKSVSTLAKID